MKPYFSSLSLLLLALLGLFACNPAEQRPPELRLSPEGASLYFFYTDS
ncbi:hypothetical protein MASR2M15_00750 [Anaerolineales bacterium]